MSDTELRGLLPYATASQRRQIETIIEVGSESGAAKKLGLSRSTIRTSLRYAKKRAARMGWAPAHDMTRTVPEGFRVRGVSTYYDGDGKPRGQWVKSAANQDDRLAMLAEAIQEITEPLAGKSRPIKAPRHVDADLLTVYPMGDPHLGMHAWGRETGEDFDLHKAERNLRAAVDHLVALSPPSEQALVINLGDFFHADNYESRTSRSGHSLDVDSRWPKVLATGIRTLRAIVDRALERHTRVTVINEIGNHDDHSAIMLSLCLEQFYSNNSRVSIDTSPAPFHWHRFGTCLIGVTHGDKVKPPDLPGIMASDRPRDWGETRHRYWYTGHIHHDTLREYPGCTVESFRTLAAKDAWHHAHGYRAGRDMKCDVLHREHGKVNRHIVGIEQLTGGIVP